MTAEPLLLTGARLVGRAGVTAEPRPVLLDGGTIRAIGDEVAARDGGGVAPRRVELDGLWLAPGYIDLQVNGAAGHDITANPETIWAVGEAIAPTGVTAFVPTVVTAPRGTAEAAQAVLAAGPPAGYRGATVLGLHIEGPFLSPRRNGAHDPALLRDPDPAFVAGWSRASGIVMATIAPELPGALELIRELTGRDIVVSLGHSAASLEVGRAGIDAGARYATHLFNAMPPLGHRDPGLIAALLADPRVTVGTIPDTIHVHPAMLDLAWRIVGPDRFSVVTDAISALGMEHGSFLLGDREVSVDATGPRLADGRLAGSVLTLDAAVRNLAAATGCDAATAVVAATSVPAGVLGLIDRGRIATGGHASLTVLTPGLEVVATVVEGRIVAGTAAGLAAVRGAPAG
jgi:N-acetylglucosamine-6-phosphate deacetylase